MNCIKLTEQFSCSFLSSRISVSYGANSYHLGRQQCSILIGYIIREIKAMRWILYVTGCVKFVAVTFNCASLLAEEKLRSFFNSSLYVLLVVLLFLLSTWYCGHYWPIVPAPDDRWWWLWSNWWNEDWQGKPKYSEKTCPNATLSTKNPNWPDPSSKARD
jgi:hypothetical protein